MNLVLEHFVRSTRGQVTKDFQRLTLPLAFRGILKKKIIQECVKNNRDYYYIDTGYFGNYISLGNPHGYKKWHRIVKNNLQNFYINYNLSRDRLDILEKSDNRLLWSGWKKRGSDILLVVPSEKPCKFYSIDKNIWLEDTVNEIKKFSDRKIIIREKATRSDRIAHNTIYDAFNNNIYATVTYNSIAAVESVAYGIPAFTLAPSAATEVTSNDLSNIENPYFPQEHRLEHWKRTLSYCQFTDIEIKTGKAWDIINEY